MPHGDVTLRHKLSIFSATLSAFLLMPQVHVCAEVDDSTSGTAVGRPEEPFVEDSEAAFPYEARVVAGPFDMPWAVAFLPDGRILVTERAGRVRVIKDGTLLEDSIGGTPDVISGGHAGLLDILVDRDFEQTHRIFLSYAHGVPGAINLRVMRATLDDMTFRDQKVLFESRPAIGGVDQIGGRLAYGPDNLLYLTIGDRGDKQRAQDLMDDAGTIVRFRDDGTIPEDNPFFGRADALPEIFSYGHRNPQGLVVSRSDGKLWSVEHGPRGGDELNQIVAGANYGWPVVTFGIDYDGTVISDRTSAAGMVDPVYKWVPSVAPSSLTSYSGQVMPQSWVGSMLMGTLAGERLVRIETTDGVVTKEVQMLHHAIGRIRDVAVGPDGYVYLLTDGREAALYRLDPVGDDIASRGGRNSKPKPGLE